VAFEELKQRQAVMWGNGPFERITETGTGAHDDLVARLAPQPGERWLDVACGTGALTFRAAKRGADVTGLDLAPAMVERARELAAEQRLDVQLEVGDCEELPYGNADFDVVSSSFGVMFAPDQQRAAHELGRVCTPGGRIGLVTWRPDGGIGQMFKTLQPFQPPPPDGVGSPLAWGGEEHVERLLGRDFELEFADGDMPLEAESGREIWELFSTSFGPVKTVNETLEGERREAYERAFIDFHEGFRTNGGIHMPREYLVTIGRRR
jgi:SAM-dependent methyltransferase